MSCPCILTTAVLRALGATSAARMHERPALLLGREWTGYDWQLHMRDEDEYFLPIVRYFDPENADALLRDHEAFRSDIARTGRILDEERVRQHSALEDALAAKMVELGIVRVE